MTYALYVKATGLIIQKDGGPFEVPLDLEWLDIVEPFKPGDKWIDDALVENVLPVSDYKELRQQAYNEAGLTPENYIDEERKDRLGQSNALAAMDAVAEQIKIDIPAT